MTPTELLWLYDDSQSTAGGFNPNSEADRRAMKAWIEEMKEKHG